MNLETKVPGEHQRVGYLTKKVKATLRLPPSSRNMNRVPRFFTILALAALPFFPAQAAVTELPPVWTGRPVQIPVTGDKVAYQSKIITNTGIMTGSKGEVAVQDGAIPYQPRMEGIHVLLLETVPPREVRFLAMSSVLWGESYKEHLLKTLPRQGKKLMAGEPFTILAMGDSVTATGNYADFLARMLTTATGNRNIKVEKRAYSGRSIDATVRHWQDDVKNIKPDLGLLMYGLNDQVTFYPLEAYLEQYSWVREHLAKEFNADVVFLQPTPHLDIPLEPGQKTDDSNPPSFILRTAGWARQVEILAKQSKVPVAFTFDAIWGRGGASLEDAARNMAPQFPPGYSKQLFSGIEKPGSKWDTIHPNALGHLAMAKAVYRSLTQPQVIPDLNFITQSSWGRDGIRSQITLLNRSKTDQIGRIEVVPPFQARLEGDQQISFDLQPEGRQTFEVLWPNTKSPASLFQFPNNQYLTNGWPQVPMVIYQNGTSRVVAAEAPMAPWANFARQREIVPAGGNASVALTAIGGNRTLKVPLPPDAVGQIPLMEKVTYNQRENWAVGTLRYTRFGGALDGEAIVDGDLTEWDKTPWAPVGEQSQARSNSGPQDNRKDPAEAYTEWAFKAGQDGIYLAMKGQGKLQDDNFTLFLDPRDPKELGTVGRYYWIGGKLLPNGRVQIKPGETSPKDKIADGIWKATEQGLNLEFFVPYSVFETTAWPASGDLGLSIWWVHSGEDGKRTSLFWSEAGHPWTPRWYGVVRRIKTPEEKLPYTVRLY